MCAQHQRETHKLLIVCCKLETNNILQNRTNFIKKKFI